MMQQEIIDLVNQFRDERNWRPFHNAKDFALSISLEASELLENYQWLSSEEANERHRENIEDEVADILIYLTMFCDDLDIDMEEVIKKKLKKNAIKYPISSQPKNLMK